MNTNVKPELLGGFQDFMPEEMILRQNLIERIRRVYESFGFLPLDTPCMESLGVITGGDSNFNKSIFTARIITGAEDRGQLSEDEQVIAMRFDLTVSLARVVAAYPDIAKPFRRYQIGKVWRGEKPQKGRFREFMQFDIDTIGSRSILADAEIIQIMYEVMEALQIPNYIIRINSRKILNALAIAVKCDNPKELFRVIDKIDKLGCEGVIAELQRPKDPKNDFDTALTLSDEQVSIVRRFLNLSKADDTEVISALSEIYDGIPVGISGITELKEITAFLSGINIPHEKYRIDLSVARGLDYYTGPVFETTLTDMPELGSVFSGGRFDGLTNRFIQGSNIPGVGASVGFDRLLVALKSRGNLNKRPSISQVLVTVFNQECSVSSAVTAQKLRQKGICTELFVDTLPLKAQLAYALKREIPWVIIIGPDEMSSGKVTMKNLAQKSQGILTFDECCARLTQ